MSETLLQEAIAETTEGWKPDPFLDLYSKAAIRSQKLSGIIGYMQGTVRGWTIVHELYTKEDIIAKLEAMLIESEKRWEEAHR
jgi:hypothetical protein